VSNEVRDLAKCRGFDVGIEGDGALALFGTFEYEGGGCQAIGSWFIDAAFLMRFLAVFGCENKLGDVNGRSCWVTHTDYRVVKVEPLHKADGRAFDVEAWERWVEVRFSDRLTIHECLTGERPPHLRRP